jgi:hypothetical protein
VEGPRHQGRVHEGDGGEAQRISHQERLRGRVRLALLFLVALLVHVSFVSAVPPAAGRDRALTDCTEDRGFFCDHLDDLRRLGGSGGGSRSSHCGVR